MDGSFGIEISMTLEVIRILLLSYWALEDMMIDVCSNMSVLIKYVFYLNKFLEGFVCYICGSKMKYLMYGSEIKNNQRNLKLLDHFKNTDTVAPNDIV